MTTRFDAECWVCDVQSEIKGFGGGSQTSTTTQNSSPWSGQQGYLSNLFGSAQGQYQNYTPQYFGYNGYAGDQSPTQIGPSTVAPMNAQQTGAISQLGNLGTNGTSAMTGANNAISSIENMNPASNPYTQQIINTTLANTIPGLESQFAQGNAMNNPAAAYATSQGASDALGSVLGNMYQKGISNQLNAASTAPYLYNTQLGGANAALTAGTQAQQQAQNELSNQVNAFNYYQQLPYNQINQYANLINGQYGVTGSSTTSTPSQSLLGSLFSDRRLKENIVRIGTAFNGLPLYLFNYIGDHVRRIGLMAQDVEKIIPDAVTDTMFGKMVNYGRALA